MSDIKRPKELSKEQAEALQQAVENLTVAIMKLRDTMIEQWTPVVQDLKRLADELEVRNV